MGSTLAGAMIEKLGLSNLPVRKHHLSEYLTGQLQPESKQFQERITRQILALSRPQYLGGVSVVERDLEEDLSIRADYSRVKKDLELFNARTFNSLSDLYSEGRRIVSKSLTYKDSDPSARIHIEYPLDFQRFSWADLQFGLRRSFAEFAVVKMRRSFSGWLNSSISQIFHFPLPKATRSIAGFSIGRRVQEYDLYNRAMDQIPGADWDFDDLFSVKIEQKIKEIQKILNLEPFPDGAIYDPSNNDLFFDLYGKLTRADKALAKFDDNIDFIPPQVKLQFDGYRRKKKSATFLKRICEELGGRARVLEAFIAYVIAGHRPRR